MTNENYCYYNSSRGILKSCDIISDTPISSTRQLVNYSKTLTNNKDGTIIYVCNSAIMDFLSYLPLINYKFILVSGDSDTTVPYESFFDKSFFYTLINSEKLIHWFSQNCVIDHPKLTRIPIGLDYHTLSEREYKWGKQKTPVKQEEDLISVKNSSLPFWEREIKCYSNFHFHFYKYGQDRKDAISQIPKNLVFYEENEVPRIESWKKQSTYSFVISPHGNGLDCHRTWEALIFGCIPIVKSSNIDALYDELPVLIVKEWSDITLELLTKTVNNLKCRTFNYNKLTLEFWVQKIKGSFI
jgi:hypothetical protein